jgi:high-affinity iron transporter
MLSAVILVFREVLEAAFIFSLLLAVTYKLHLSRRWSLPAFIGGIISSWVASSNARSISQAFDGSGQEILNCLLFLGIIGSVIIFSFILLPYAFPQPNHINKNQTNTTTDPFIQGHRKWIYSIFIVAIISAITREGSEIWIYLSSVGSTPPHPHPTLLGGAIGAGIGLSLGTIAYYLFIFIPQRAFYGVLWIALTLMVGGLATQMAKELMQMGILESSQPLWNSSWLINEHSLVGEFFHALLSYEAKPTAAQVSFFIIAAIPIIIPLMWQLFIKNRKFRNTEVNI